MMPTTQHNQRNQILRPRRIITILLVIFGMSAIWHSLPDKKTVQATTSAPSADHSARRIDEIRPGMRVLAKNPQLENSPAESFIEPQAWRLIHLKMAGQGTDVFDIHLLRSLNWITQAEAAVGRTIHLVVEEQGLNGPAEVLAIEPCPTLEEKRHPDAYLVTGTFTHFRQVLDVWVNGLEEPIGTTDNHPFWSEDRRDFVPAGILQPGESLRLLNGSTATVKNIQYRGPPERVYNLEVDTQHVYYVTTAGVLVHNDCMITVIGRMDDLVKFKDDPGIDTWWRSGRIPKPGEDPPMWKENEAWLLERIARGDKFGIATDPSILPPVIGGWEKGNPNGYFTARELKFLQDRGIEVMEMF